MDARFSLAGTVSEEQARTPEKAAGTLGPVSPFVDDSGEMRKDSSERMEDEEGKRSSAEEEKQCPMREHEEERAPNILRSPVKPSRREVEEHNAVHMPYRDWCPHCVRGRGIDSPHRTTEKDPSRVPMICADYGYLSNKAGDHPHFIVMRDNIFGATFQYDGPTKGSKSRLGSAYMPCVDRTSRIQQHHYQK